MERSHININLIRAEVQFLYLTPMWAPSELAHWGEDDFVFLGDSAHALDRSQANEVTSESSTRRLTDFCAAALGKSVRAKHRSDHLQHINLNIPSEFVRHVHMLPPSKARTSQVPSKIDVNAVSEYSMYCFLWLIIKLSFTGEFLEHKAT